MIGPRPFYLIAALCTAAGIALRFVPVTSAEVADVAPLAPAATAVPRAAPPDDPGRYAAIAASNAFSADRKAPKVRWVPEGLRKDTVKVAKTPKKPPEPTARLFGISRGPGGTVALIDADPDVPGAEVYRVGDVLRAGRISNISETTVTLSRSSGPLVLHLPDSGDKR